MEETNDLTLGIAAQRSSLEGEITGFGVPIQTNYNFILPEASLRMDIGGGKNIRIRYRTDTQEPSLQQLQPIVDNTDPLNIYVGNPDLKPEYEHSIFSEFRWFDQFTFMSVYTNLRASITSNKISRNRDVDPQFIQRITPVNVDGDWSVGGFQNFGYPVRALGAQINISNSLNYGRSAEFIDSIENRTRSLRDNVRLSIGNRDKELFDINIGGNLTFFSNTYSLNDQFNQNYLNKSFTGSIAIMPTEQWRISTDVDATFYSDEVFGQADDIVTWNAELSRALLSNNRAQFVIVARDLLNQGEGVNYTNSAGFIRESRVKSIGRYTLVKFIFNLSERGGDGGGGGRRGRRSRF